MGTDKNYKQLVQMHEKYAAQGFEIIAFPCNQFGGQEPGTAQEIEQFIREKYGGKFPIITKADVNGRKTQAVYQYLRRNSDLYDYATKSSKNILWNFGKFLVDDKEEVLHYYLPGEEPD